MAAEPQRRKTREGVISTLNAAVEIMNLANERTSITPAKVVFGSASDVLTIIRVRFLLVCVDRLHIEMHPGLDDKPGGLRRTWAGLR